MDREGEAMECYLCVFVYIFVDADFSLRMSWNTFPHVQM